MILERAMSTGMESEDLDLILTLPQIDCLNMSKSLHFPGPQFLHPKKRRIKLAVRLFLVVKSLKNEILHKTPISNAGKSRTLRVEDIAGPASSI